MASPANRFRGGSDNSWPGFVDALSTLLLAIIFLLSLFVLAQFFLSQALTGREQALSALRAEVLELGNLLALEKDANKTLQDTVSNLSASLGDTKAERDQLSIDLASTKAALETSSKRLEALAQRNSTLEKNAGAYKENYEKAAANLEEQIALSARARAQVARLEANIAALRDQLSRLELALDAADKRDEANQTVIVDLGRRLNRALAAKVEELAGYRSAFFARLSQVLAKRPEVRIVDDRFVLGSELLFESGSADLGLTGQAELRQLAATLLEIAEDIPPELNWVLRVDGHTDRRPIFNNQFQSNWQLSAARAIAVVEFLIAAGLPPQRLAATGFGEFQPLDSGSSQAALARNRRIEFRLTQR